MNLFTNIYNSILLFTLTDGSGPNGHQRMSGDVCVRDGIFFGAKKKCNSDHSTK